MEKSVQVLGHHQQHEANADGDDRGIHVGDAGKSQRARHYAIPRERIRYEHQVDERQDAGESDQSEQRVHVHRQHEERRPHALGPGEQREAAHGPAQKPGCRNGGNERFTVFQTTALDGSSRSASCRSERVAVATAAM